MRKKLIFLPFLFIMTMLFAILLGFSKTKVVYAADNYLRLVRNEVVVNEYSSFATIMIAAQDGDVIELTKDYSGTFYPLLDKNVVFDFCDYTLTLTGGYFIIDSDDVVFRASGSGGLTKASGRCIYFGQNGDHYGSDTHLTIESGVYDVFNLYYSDGAARDLSSATVAEDLEDNITINGGTFMFVNNDFRNGLRNFISSHKLVLSTDSPKRTLTIKNESYVSSENTKASAKISYTEGYSCYQKVTSLSSSDAGKQYILAYVNKTEDVIYIMKNYANASYHTMYTDKHNNVNRTNDGTWYINSNSEFIGDVDEDFFVELGWDSNGYTFTVNINDANPSNDQCLFYNKTAGSRLEPMSDSYKSDTTNYIYKFGFNTVDYYFYPIGVNSLSIVYTPNLEYANLIRVAAPSYESGLGDNHNVRLHLFEKVDIDPVVDSASLRFGDCITKEMYDYLSGCGTTVTFGVVAKLTSALGGEELKYANAQIKKAITPVRVSAAGATEEDLEGNFYQFALVLSGITSSNFDTSVTARCYVCVDGDYYYFNESVYSLKTLANAYYNAVDTSSYTEHLPVLGYLKDYGD